MIGFDFTETSRDASFCTYAVLQSDLMMVEDATTDERFSANSMVTGEPGIRFYAGAPLVLSGGYSVGTICVADRMARRLTPHQQESLRIVRDQVVRLLEAHKREAELNRAISTAEGVQRILHETEKRFFQFLEEIPIGVFVIDSDGNPHYANQAAQQLLGRGIVPHAGPEDLADKYQAFMAGTNQPYPAGLMPIVRALAGERCMITDMEIHRNNKIIPVQVWGAPIHNHDGAISFAIAAFADISERKKTEQRLQALNAVTKVLGESSSLAESVVGIAKAVCESMRWDIGLIWDLDRKENVLYCVDVWHSPATSFSDFIGLSRQLRFPIGYGVPGQTWARRGPLWIKDVVQDSNFPRMPAALKSNLHGAFAFPVMRGDDLIRVFEFYSRDIQEPDEALLDTSRAIASQIEQFQFRKWIEQELTRLGSAGA